MTSVFNGVIVSMRQPLKLILVIKYCFQLSNLRYENETPLYRKLLVEDNREFIWLNCTYNWVSFICWSDLILATIGAKNPTPNRLKYPRAFIEDFDFHAPIILRSKGLAEFLSFSSSAEPDIVNESGILFVWLKSSKHFRSKSVLPNTF